MTDILLQRVPDGAIVFSAAVRFEPPDHSFERFVGSRWIASEFLGFRRRSFRHSREWYDKLALSDVHQSQNRSLVKGGCMRWSIISRQSPNTAVGRYARLLALIATAVISLGFDLAVASQRETVLISTEKPLGPSIGTFAASGAFVDAGALITEQRVVSALPSPFGVVTHLVLRFEGEQGTFTLRTEIIESATEDPEVFTNAGTWAVIDGDGVYATLRGTGSLEGTVDGVANLIVRVFAGEVHFN